MTEREQVCEYLKAMAAKIGGDVDVVPAEKGLYAMSRRGDLTKRFLVSMNEPTESFERKVKYLMEE